MNSVIGDNTNPVPDAVGSMGPIGMSPMRDKT